MAFDSRSQNHIASWPVYGRGLACQRRRSAHEAAVARVVVPGWLSTRCAGVIQVGCWSTRWSGLSWPGSGSATAKPRRVGVGSEAGLPAAGAGTAAGRLRWVGHEREGLRRWLTIDGRPAAATTVVRASLPAPQRLEALGNRCFSWVNLHRCRLSHGHHPGPAAGGRGGSRGRAASLGES